MPQLARDVRTSITHCKGFPLSLSRHAFTETMSYSSSLFYSSKSVLETMLLWVLFLIGLQVGMLHSEVQNDVH